MRRDTRRGNVAIISKHIGDTWIPELKDAIDPFRRSVSIVEPLRLPDAYPARDAMAGIWPTLGELRKLVSLIEALPVAPEEGK
jgi:hypothetical protein